MAKLIYSAITSLDGYINDAGGRFDWARPDEDLHVDECHLFLNPIVVGGGTRALPDGALARLELVAEHRFASGVVHVGYRVA
jgi:dihydrofolate reductase